MAHSRRRFALVVPTLNEAGNITGVLDRAIAALSGGLLPWEILVVDDESSDGTCDLVRPYEELRTGVRICPRHGEHGLAGAITYGWSQTDADLIGVMDADLQHPPELLPVLIDAVCKGADIAIASRYLQPDSMDDWNPIRRFLSRMGVLASKPVQRPKLRVSDSLSGFFVLRRECITGISFQKTGFKLLLEILAKGRLSTVVEVPFRFAIRNRGKSKANAMTAVHYFVLLCKLSAGLITSRRRR